MNMGQTTLTWDKHSHKTDINMGQALTWDKHSHKTDINMGQTTLT
jgi:hypothetical protein